MIKKEAYYFSHDSNARQDDKIVALRMKHGWEGYGLFWAIIEKLRDTSDYMCVKDYNLIAFDLRVDSQKIKSIIEDFGLFEQKGNKFYSTSLLERMSIRTKASISGIKGNLIKHGYISKNESVSLSDQEILEIYNTKLSPRHRPESPPGRILKESKVKNNTTKCIYLFVSIKNLNEYFKNFEGNKTYFLIAYRFWELWSSENPNHGHLKKANVYDWVDTIRLIIERDNHTIDRLVAVMEYFRKCQEQDKRFKDFWYKTIKSINALRNADKNGVRYLDLIAEEVNEMTFKMPEFGRLIKERITKIKNHESIKLSA